MMPAARHAKVVEELTDRLRACVLAAGTPGLLRHLQHEAELLALIEIVERHQPEFYDSMLLGCYTCTDGHGEWCEWPCEDFLSAERAVQQEKPCERPAKRGE